MSVLLLLLLPWVLWTTQQDPMFFLMKEQTWKRSSMFSSMLWIQKKIYVYVCLHVGVLTVSMEAEDSIRFPINLIDWMARKYPGSPCVLGFCCHDKTLTQSNLVKKGFISFYSLQSIIEGSQCRNWRQGLMQRLWSNTVYWLVPCSLLSLLYYITQDHHCSTTHNELDPPISVINQEN